MSRLIAPIGLNRLLGSLMVRHYDISTRKIGQAALDPNSQSALDVLAYLREPRMFIDCDSLCRINSYGHRQRLILECCIEKFLGRKTRLIICMGYPRLKDFSVYWRLRHPSHVFGANCQQTSIRKVEDSGRNGRGLEHCIRWG